MRQRGGGRATKVLLTLGSIGLAIGGAELCTLFGYDYRVPFNTPVKYEYSRYVQTDPELLFRTRPSLRESGIQYGGDIVRMWNIETDQISEIHWDMHLDPNGFRNPDGLTRASVAVIGDSFVVGRPVAATALMTSILAKGLQRPVANLGQTGYGPQQELILLRRFAMSYRPQVVVWALFEGNDLNDALWFEAVRDKWTAMVAAEHSFAKRSMLTNAFAATMRLLQRPTESVFARTRSGTLPDGRRMWFHHEMGPWTEWELAALEGVVGGAVAEAHRLCVDQGIGLVLLFLPDKFRIYGDICTFPEDSDCRTWSLDDFPQRLESIVRRVSPDIGFLDLTPAFRERATAGELLFFPDDTHWNGAGHARAGEALVAFLQQRHFIR